MTAIHEMRVHIVEDDPEFGAYLLELLEDTGVSDAELFDDGLAGLRAILRDVPDLVVLDLNLPSLRGEEICRVIRSSPVHNTIRILVCSDMPEAQRRELELLQIGADIYVEKPFEEGAFIDQFLRLAAAPRKSAMPFDATERKKLLEETKPLTKEQIRIVWNDVQLLEETRQLAPEPPSEEDNLSHDMFSGYTIQSVIGGGATGTVYRAYQNSLERVVALKVFLRRAEDPRGVLEQFEREAKIMAQLNHPNIVQVFDTGQTGYTHYIAMEYMPGGSLMDLVEKREVTWEICRQIIEQAGDALVYLHDRHIIHRDIKPGNILISELGKFKLGDFGLSQPHVPLDRKEFTDSDMVMGTRIYMAPELLMGMKANEKTDQFAWGRTILRLFEGDEANFPAKPLVELGIENIPGDLSAVIERCMHADPAQRFPTLRDAIAAMLIAMGERRINRDSTG